MSKGKVTKGIIEQNSARYEYTYSDELFSSSAFDYSHALAKQSLALAVASMNCVNNGDYSKGYQNLEKMLSECGYKKFFANEDFKKRPEANSFGVGIAHKTIWDGATKHTILAIGLRGGVYGSEWSGNFNLGESGNHKGFDIASEIVFDEVRYYLSRYGITGNVILWVSGFSRAGAVTNLFGGKINDYLSNGEQPFRYVTLEQRKAFFYTFEAPRGALSENVEKRAYRNIFNIINQNDIVVYSAPKALGFSRYGIDLILPVKENSEKDFYDDLSKAVKKQFQSINKVEIKKFNPNFMCESLLLSPIKKIFDDINVSDFLEEYFLKLSEELGGREQCQSLFIAVQKAMELLFFPVVGVVPSITKVLKHTVESSAEEVIESIFTENFADATAKLESSLYETLSSEGVSIDSIKESKPYVDEIFAFFRGFAEKYPDDFDIMILNIIAMISTHDRTLELAYLESLPDNYFKY